MKLYCFGCNHDRNYVITFCSEENAQVLECSGCGTHKLLEAVS